MSISTLDGVIAGFKPPMPIVKVGITTAAVSAMRGYTLWYASGNPGAATAPSAGINGTAVSTPKAGEIPRTDPGSGNAYLGRFSINSSTAGVMMLIDRLWENSGLSVTSTSAQAITPASLPSRDSNASTNGDAVLAADPRRGIRHADQFR